MKKNIVGLVASLLFLTACSVNPVTGKRQVVFMSTAQEIAMGQQNYSPMQQAEGGLYDVDPELTRYVQRVGQRVASQSGVDLPYEFVVLNNSVPNAWALPGGKIAVNRGLLTEMESEAELAAVLGHEVVHAAARHTAQQQSRAMMMQVGVIGAAVASSDSDYANLAIGGASLLAQAGLARYGRSAELESDRYGMEYMSAAGYDPQGAVQLQETFVRLSEGRRSDWLSGLFASHPPSPERVAANRATAARLPGGGEMGRDSYQAELRRVRRVEPAYEAYDEGRKALAEKDSRKARELANKAIGLYGEEAHFYALLGDSRLVDKNYSRAATEYTRAIERRENFFYYHLQRGLVRKELGDTNAAARDLNRSIELLPTAPAHNALGDIANARGDTRSAIEHYRVVAQYGGDYGQMAAGKLVRIDLPSNPSAYVRAACDADSNGNLIVRVRNESPVMVRDVEVTVNYNDRGRPVSRRFSVDGRLSPNQIGGVNTRIGPYYRDQGCPAQVTRARVAE